MVALRATHIRDVRRPDQSPVCVCVCILIHRVGVDDLNAALVVAK